jgi:hypothetical protein
MPVDAALQRLATQIGAFHITEASMRKAQQRIESAIAGGHVNADLAREYLAAAARYFAAFDREARAHLRDVDRRLTRANQVAFNLTAERAVAVKRIEATSAVLAAIPAVEGGAH